MATKKEQRTGAGADSEADLLAEGSLSVEGACNFLAVGRSRLYQLVREGKLRAFKSGTRTCIPRRSAINYQRELLRSAPLRLEVPAQLAAANAALRGRRG